MDTSQVYPQIVSITDFRRNAGAYLDQINTIGSYLIIRDSQPYAKIIPVKTTKKQSSVEEDLAKIKSLSGGFNFKKSFTPKRLNELYDKDVYGQVLS